MYSGVPGAAEPSAHPPAPKSHLGSEELVTISMGIVGMRGNDDQSVASTGQVADERTPTALRRSDFGPVVMGE